MGGLPRSIASVMPVSAVTAASTGTAASTRVWNVPRRSPPRNRAAPTSVMAQVAAEAPVVSRSTTQNVTSCRGVARSSTLCSMRAAWYPNIRLRRTVVPPRSASRADR